ncbi:hypothetical protein AaE_002265, partial [Aphanomyces astaci]
MPWHFHNTDSRAFAKMSAPIDDLLYDDDDDDDISMEDTGMAAGGLAQQPVAMGMLAPPSAVLAPQQMLVQPPVGVIAPPHSAMATPIAYTPSPTGPPPATTPEEKIKNLFQLIHKRFPEKYKPLHDEVRNRPMVVKNDLSVVLDLVKRALGDTIFGILCQEVGGFYTPAFAKCEDIKRFFKHTVTCTAGRECNHCEQLRTLVKLHATDCAVGPRDRCPIPFCDNMRLN